LFQERIESEEEQQAGPSKRDSSPEVVVVEQGEVEVELPDTKPGPQELQANVALAMIQGRPGSEAWELTDAGPNLVLRRIYTYVVPKPAQSKSKKKKRNNRNRKAKKSKSKSQEKVKNVK
jgi:hypothetical protein